MGKITISKLFLYRHRFVIGYLLLTIVFLATLFLLPLIAPNGLSTQEMESAITSSHTDFTAIKNGDLVDLPYRILQKYSIAFFGLSAYTIKLPSIFIGGILGVLFILLLNRWFKSNVAIIASIITVLSSSFLYLSGSGTPLIMIVFWPTLLLWLGSKIQGKKSPKPLYSFVFAFCLLLALFTPFMPYLVSFIVLYALMHPHLRFTIKTLPKLPLVLVTLIIIAGVGVITSAIVKNSATLTSLLFTPDFSLDLFFHNISSSFLPFFSWSKTVESTFLSPLIGLASLVLAIIGLCSTAKGFFASRNSIASYFILFSVIMAGFKPKYAILIILPLAILIAHGIRYTLNKWYRIFPQNPYARIFAIFPIGLFLGIIIISDLSHFVFGYRYNPAVANQFNNDLSLIQKLDDSTTILIPENTLEYEFYKLLEKPQLLNLKTKNHPIIKSNSSTFSTTKVATLRRYSEKTTKLELQHIITSPKSSDSDRIYLYTVK